MKNLFFKKGDTNWLGVVLVSALIGALTSWVIIFVCDSVLEISAPNYVHIKSGSLIRSKVPVYNNVSINGLCGLRIAGRQPSSTEQQQCQASGGEIVCNTTEIDYVDRPGTSENFCDCVCAQQ